MNMSEGKDSKPAGCRCRGAIMPTRGFTLVELLVVIAIMGILIAVGMQAFTDPANSARKSAGDVLRGHLQEARAHAIATGNLTCVLFPDYTSLDKASSSLIGIAEVESQANSSNPYKVTKLLQRWTSLPETIFFLDRSTCKSDYDTILDARGKIDAQYQKRTINCNYVVFSPTGLIISPQATTSGQPALSIALGKGTLRGGGITPTQRNQTGIVFDFLQINRLSARARMASPDVL